LASQNINSFFVVVVITFMLGAVAPSAQAAITAAAFERPQSGSVDIVALGTLNLAAWSFGSVAPRFGEVNAQRSLIIGPANPGGNTTDQYINPVSFTGPSDFGPGTGTAFTIPDSGLGSVFGLIFAEQRLFVPAGYQSGDLLQGTSTYENETFASLGMEVGTYTWSWGAGDTADSFTLEVGNPVPLPSAVLLLGGGLIGLLGLRRKLKN
jgi:hypothetical protein